MNYIKAQKEVFTALCNGKKMGRFNLMGDNVLVTPNGYMAYIFPLATVNFCLEKIPEITDFPVVELVQKKNKLSLTPDMRIGNDKHTILRRLRGEGKNVFINIKFLSCFQNPSFYQAENPNSTIVVTEHISLGGHGTRAFYEKAVGVILPVRADALQGDYYAWSDAIEAVTA